MLCKLAWGNVRRAGKDYLVYLLTLALSVTVFYAFNTISFQVDLAGVDNDGMAELLGGLISGLTLFLGLVMGFLMVYANNFIMKRRKKEFGLYQVLGMSRGQVARIMALETAFVSGAAFVVGIVLGVGLSQLMVFFTASLFHTQIADFQFFFSFTAFMITALCLVSVFVVTLVFNLRVVARARIIELVGADRRSEEIKLRNPWIAAIVGIVGAALIGFAYARLLHDGMPIDGDPVKMNTFLITTLMVVIGTFLFFFGFSGLMLKLLQGVRGLYWRGLNMFTLRQLSAKVNTASFSMAVIAMILFLAITSVTTGMSIANTMNTAVVRGTPVDFTRTLVYMGQQSAEESNAEAAASGNGEHYAVAPEPIDVMGESRSDAYNLETQRDEPFDLMKVAGDYIQVDAYDSMIPGQSMPLVTLSGLCDAVDMEQPSGTETSDVASLGLMVMKESDYNRYLRFRGMDEVHVGKDGYTLLSDMGASVNDIYNAVLSQGVAIDFNGHTLKPVQQRVNEDASVFMNSMMGMNSGTIVVADELIEDAGLQPYYSYLLVNYADGVSTEEGDAYLQAYRPYRPITDANGDIVALWGGDATRTSSYEAADSMNGLISYLAIYIGFVLVIACAAILTIQQLSGVADAGRSYRVLSELGTSKHVIMRSVLTQQAVFYLFPLIVAVAHSLIALRVIIQLVQLFGGLSIAGMAGFTVLIFLLAYGGYFLVAYLMSRSMVHDAIHARHEA